MKHNFNSSAVRNEVTVMQTNNTQTPVKAGKIDKATLVVMAYIASAIGVLIALNSLGLIPKD